MVGVFSASSRNLHPNLSIDSKVISISGVHGGSRERSLSPPALRAPAPSLRVTIHARNSKLPSFEKLRIPNPSLVILIFHMTTKEVKFSVFCANTVTFANSFSFWTENRSGDTFTSRVFASGKCVLALFLIA